MNRNYFIEWMDEHLGEIENAMRKAIDQSNPARVYGNSARAVMSLTFTKGDPLGIGDLADDMLTHYRAEVAKRMGEEINRKQTMSGYPLEFAMTSNPELLAMYYNICAKFAREEGEDCVVSVARY